MEIVWQTPANPPQPNDYIFRNGRRLVRPYYFEFISHAKCRWAGKTIVDLFTEEFKGRSYEYFVNAVKSGRIQVNGQKVSISYRVQASEKISHFLHRHEPPLMASDISVLQIEPDVVIVCKPASVPVHPCGQYRKNTVLGILQAEHSLAPLFLHRLDRLVSGLLILARNANKADQFRQQIEAGMVQKAYIAKVVGVFPEEEQVVDANVNYNARDGRSTVQVGHSNSEKALRGKKACTKFTRISTNGTHSVVLCKPITGRTHQIRVHLQHLGHPIANDVLYLSEVVSQQFAKGTGAGRAAVFVKIPHSMDPTFPGDNDFAEELASNEDFSIDPMCTHCPNLAPNGYDGHEEALWLHCLRYSGPGWQYECPYPDWAFLG